MGLDLVSSSPEELWTEVHNIVQKTVNKTIPKRWQSKKSKCLSEEALQIAEERREAKNKGEKERHIQLNTDFPRIAKRDKKAFFSEWCLKIEENNRRGKSTDLFRKIGNIEGTFGPKMGTIRDTNGRDLVDAEEIKNTWKNCAKKSLNEPDYYDGVVSHPEPNILECETKRALESTAIIKPVDVMEFQ